MATRDVERDGAGSATDRTDCRWFFSAYSDYRDDRMGPRDRARAAAHLEACDSCRRYDRVVRTGVRALHETDASASARPAHVSPIEGGVDLARRGRSESDRPDRRARRLVAAAVALFLVLAATLSLARG